MTCQDCIHFDNGICRRDADHEWGVMPDEPVDDCKAFTNNDGTYSNGSWHCPRCGVPVSKWGLCMDCEILYITPERRTVSVNLKIDNIIKHEFDFSDIEETEDSWESVSK